MSSERAAAAAIGWRRAALVGALVAAIVTLPGLGTGSLWDNSETAYGEVAREILLYRDPIVMHLNGRPWFVQPPLYFWIAAAFAKLLGVTSLALRLPSALATIGMGAVVGGIVARFASERVAILTTVILTTSLMQAIIGRLAIMDALLDLCVAAAILAWFGSLRTGSARAWYLGSAAVACGSLAKGPVAPVVALLVLVPWFVWERRRGTALKVPALSTVLGGFAVFAAVVLPWTIALVARVGIGSLGTLVGHYTVGRYLGTIENQSGPIWYYLPVVVLGFFPWFAFLLPALVDAARAGRNPDRSLERLAVVWAIAPLIFFSLAKTKLPNYIALELPALAFLVAVWFDRIARLVDRRAAVAWAALVPATIAGIAFAIARFSRDMHFGGETVHVTGDLAILGIIVGTGAIACFLGLTVRALAPVAPYALAATSVAAILVVALIAEPQVERFKPIPTLAAIIDRERRPGDVVAIQGIGGDNALIFYTRPPVAILNSSTAGVVDPATDPRRAICSAPRAFVVSSRTRPAIDPTYGRNRRTLATADGAVLYLYDGPACS
ncbi:MAG: ArnT family glycosyltransferase [Vulcanimicrobiaceae bacterium]